MSQGKVSVIIASRVEPYVGKTIQDILDNAAGNVEVIMVQDGVIPDHELPDDKRLKIYRNAKTMGLRACLNAAIDVARSKYIFKIDAHCTIGEGWDEILKADCEDNWIVIPRRYWFDAPTWTIKDKPHVDAMVYMYPFVKVYQPRLTARPWPERAEEFKDETLVEDMSYQGSAWFMHRKHWDRIGGMPATDGYGMFGEEPQEIGLKTQLGPWEGKVMRNKKTWYAHWSKPFSHWHGDPEEKGRVPSDEFFAANDWAFHHWWNNQWDEQVHDFQWLIDKFWPLPKWPENWRWLVSQYDRYEFPEPAGVFYPAIDKTEFQRVK